MDELIKDQFGHYKDNPEYWDYYNELNLMRHSEKPLPEKEFIINKFQAYNNLRVDLEGQMEDRVHEIKFELETLPKNHKCNRFYLKQKLELERSYTRANSVKKKVVLKNIIPCPFDSENQITNIDTNNGIDYTDNIEPKLNIIPQIDAQVNSKLGHHQDNKEYFNFLTELIIAKESEISNQEKLIVLQKFMKYNSQRLKLEELIDERLSDIKLEVDALAKSHKCVKFYSNQSWALRRAFIRDNSVKQKVLRANSKMCPYIITRIEEPKIRIKKHKSR